MIKANYKQMLDYMQQSDNDLLCKFGEKFPQGGEHPSTEEYLKLAMARMEILGNTLTGILQKLSEEERKQSNLIITK